MRSLPRLTPCNRMRWRRCSIRWLRVSKSHPHPRSLCRGHPLFARSCVRGSEADMRRPSSWAPPCITVRRTSILGIGRDCSLRNRASIRVPLPTMNSDSTLINRLPPTMRDGTKATYDLGQSLQTPITLRIAAMRITYDSDARAGYIYLTGAIEAGGVKPTIPVGGNCRNRLVREERQYLSLQ